MDRASGGLLGVAAAEVLASCPRRFGPVRPIGHLGPMGAALLDVGFGYLAHRGVGAPVDVVHGHRGVGGTGWLLALVVARSGVPELVGATVDLAEALEHHVAGGDPADDGRLLAITDPEHQVDPARAVAVPLRGWGDHAQLRHSPPHGPDRTPDRPRRAYIVNFVNPVRYEDATGRKP